MESNLLPRDLMKEVFDIMRKNDKLYVLMKSDDDKSEERIKDVLGDEDVEFMDIADVIEKHMIKEFSDAISIFDNETILDRFGLKQFTEIIYDLSSLNQSKKMLFNYSLFGRRDKGGLVQNSGGKRIGRSVVYIPSKNEKDIESLIKRWAVKYSKRRVIDFE